MNPVEYVENRGASCRPSQNCNFIVRVATSLLHQSLYHVQNDRQTEDKLSWKYVSTGQSVVQEAQIGNHSLVWKTGKLARLADAACVCGLGGTEVLATVVCDRSQIQQTDMVPLQVMKPLSNNFILGIYGTMTDFVVEFRKEFHSF